jgi:hypothetical protein
MTVTNVAQVAAHQCCILLLLRFRRETANLREGWFLPVFTSFSIAQYSRYRNIRQTLVWSWKPSDVILRISKALDKNYSMAVSRHHWNGRVRNSQVIYFDIGVKCRVPAPLSSARLSPPGGLWLNVRASRSKPTPNPAFLCRGIASLANLLEFLFTRMKGTTLGWIKWPDSTCLRFLSLGEEGGVGRRV